MTVLLHRLLLRLRGPLLLATAFAALALAHGVMPAGAEGGDQQGDGCTQCQGSETGSSSAQSGGGDEGQPAGQGDGNSQGNGDQQGNGDGNRQGDEGQAHHAPQPATPQPAVPPPATPQPAAPPPATPPPAATSAPAPPAAPAAPAAPPSPAQAVSSSPSTVSPVTAPSAAPRSGGSGVRHLVTRHATPVSPRHRKRAAAHHEAVAVPTPGMRRPEPPLIQWPAHRRALHLAAGVQPGDRSPMLVLAVLAVALFLPLLALPFVGRRRY